MTNTGKQSTIKLAAIDLDGTLLDGREQIPTKTVDHLITLQQNGLRIVLCSGRSPFEMEVYARQLQMDVYDGYLIYTNGSGIEGCQSDLSLRFPSLRASQIHTLLRIGRTFHLLIYAPQEGCYFLEGGPRMKRLFAFGRQRCPHPTHPLTKLFSLVIIVEDLERALSQQTNKLCFRGSPPADPPDGRLSGQPAAGSCSASFISPAAASRSIRNTSTKAKRSLSSVSGCTFRQSRSSSSATVPTITRCLNAFPTVLPWAMPIASPDRRPHTSPLPTMKKACGSICSPSVCKKQSCIRSSSSAGLFFCFFISDLGQPFHRWKVFRRSGCAGLRIWQCQVDLLLSQRDQRIAGFVKLSVQVQAYALAAGPDAHRLRPSVTDKFLIGQMGPFFVFSR